MPTTTATRTDPGRPNSKPYPVAEVGQVYRYAAHATDPDGNDVTYSLGAAPAGMAWSAVEGAPLYTPTAAQQGIAQVTVRARDCNDPAVSAQVRPLKHMPRRGSSCRAPGVGAGGCRTGSSRRSPDSRAAGLQWRKYRAPDWTAGVVLAKREFRQVAGVQWQVSMANAAGEEIATGWLCVPEGGGPSGDGESEAWVWLQWAHQELLASKKLSISGVPALKSRSTPRQVVLPDRADRLRRMLGVVVSVLAAAVLTEVLLGLDRYVDCRDSHSWLSDALADVLQDFFH